MIKAIGAELRALMVEDSPDDAELIQIVLRRSGYHVHARRVASEADYLDALDNDVWDIVLSDFSMPGFGGRAALEILQRKGIDLPFIVVSGTVGEDAAVQVMKAGAHDFFSKNHLTRLASAIEREVREAERRRADTTERHRAASELEQLLVDLRSAIRARDDFLSIASHELKTPLTSLRFGVQLMERQLAAESTTPIAATMLPQLARIDRQVHRLSGLVDSLLDVTRLAAGGMALSLEQMDLRDVVLEVVARCTEAIRQRGSELMVTTVSAVGRWDRQRIHSVIANLLLNAGKYGQGKPIDVVLDIEGSEARLVVRDHGMGIAPEARQRIFEKFERAVPLEHFGGLGLGLWIARQAVVAHGGDISCDSEAGAGSTFSVRLPLSQEREQPRSEAARTDPEPSQPR